MRWRERNIETVVVKVGSALVTSPEGLAMERIEALAEVLSACSGLRPAVVSSGSVAAGAPLLGLGGKKHRPESTENRQAAAAAGQGAVFSLWSEAFRKQGTVAAQILLTAEDLAARSRYLNIRRTFQRLFELGAVPVINENDTVSVRELVLRESFGDNDGLAALVAGILNADLLLILSDVDGLYEKNPHLFPEARRIAEVEKTDGHILSLGGKSHQRLSRGGMRSKLLSVRKVVQAGCPAAIIDGRDPENVRRFFAGEPVGTFFKAEGLLSHKRRWIGHAARVQGVLVLDEGAVRALRNKGASLLPSGVAGVEGEFKEGAVVSFETPDKEEIGRGISEYSSEAIRQIRQKPSRDIRPLLGYVHRNCVVHRNNMTVYESEVKSLSQ